MSDIYCQRLKSKNDVNGNPRRLIVVYGRLTGDLLAVIDEGYSGVPRYYSDVTGLSMDPTWLPDVNIAPAEYRKWLKHETVSKPLIIVKT